MVLVNLSVMDLGFVSSSNLPILQLAARGAHGGAERRAVAAQVVSLETQREAAPQPLNRLGSVRVPAGPVAVGRYAPGLQGGVALHADAARPGRIIDLNA